MSSKLMISSLAVFLLWNGGNVPALEYVEVSRSAVMCQNQGENGSNITCLVVDDGLVFVDSSFFTEIAAQFRKDMEARFQKKTIALLITHPHTDHFFGMGAFEDVPVYAAATGKEVFQRQISINYRDRIDAYKLAFPRIDEALQTARFFLPTNWFEEEIRIGSAKSQVLFRNTGGHTACSSYAYHVAEDILAPGDNVQVDQYPFFGAPTTDMDTWIRTLGEYESMDIQKICPGHGSTVGKTYALTTRQYFQNLISTLKRLKEDGVPAEDIASHPSLPKGYWQDDAVAPPWWVPALTALYRKL